MGRNKCLSEREIGQILAFRQEGHSEREIATRIGRSKTVVHNFLVNPEHYGQNKSTGRPKVLSDRDSRHILRIISSELKSCPQVQHELGLECHRSTVYRAARSAENFDFRKANSKPPLKPEHVKERLEFTRKYIDFGEKWYSVMFSDEKKFNLDGPDGFRYYWHDLRKDPKIFSRRQFGGGSVMVWAGIAYNGCTEIAFITTHESSSSYIETLNQYMVSQFHEICGINGIFQQDNASIHTSRKTRDWLAKQNISLMSWPSRSPDLNPIENIWADLTRRVYRNGRQFNSCNDLKRAISEEWSMFDQSHIHCVILSMKDRLVEVIEKKGQVTSY